MKQNQKYFKKKISLQLMKKSFAYEVGSLCFRKTDKQNST